MIGALAAVAMSATGNTLSDGAVSYSTLLASRKERTVPALIAKLMFCGMSPVPAQQHAF